MTHADSNQPSLDIAQEVQSECCDRERFLVLGEKHKAGEIYMTTVEQGNRLSGKVKGVRYLWKVTYEILKTACAAPEALEPRPERFVQVDMI